MLRLLSGIFMGWSLGSNDSANVFGTAVASKTIKFKTAAALCSFFVIVGALAGGTEGMATLNRIVDQTLETAFITSLSAGITVTLMTLLKLPVSTSQAVVGAIIGIGINLGNINLSGFNKIIFVWIGTPLGTILISLIIYPVFRKIINSLPINIFTRDYVLKTCLIFSGCYAAYSLGANNVANVTGIYSEVGILTVTQALLLGGMSIALGVATFSKNVMLTVGKRLIRLDPYSAFIAVLSQAVTLDIYSRIGVPTSSSQAIIGAVLGIGILKGAHTINKKTLLSIFTGWICTPMISIVISLMIFHIIIG
jgi:inorganic phosphate transporter, PiT family